MDVTLEFDREAELVLVDAAGRDAIDWTNRRDYAVRVSDEPPAGIRWRRSDGTAGIEVGVSCTIRFNSASPDQWSITVHRLAPCPQCGLVGTQPQSTESA